MTFNPTKGEIAVATAAPYCWNKVEAFNPTKGEIAVATLNNPQHKEQEFDLSIQPKVKLLSQL